MGQRVVLAYSGGLDTSVCVKWLTLRGYDVIAFMADVGQGGDFKRLSRRATQTGASRVVVRDLTEEFARNFIMPALQANAVYEGKYLLATALSRPLIAKHLVDVAHQHRATAIAHGCTGKGNDQVRFETTVMALDGKLKIVAPVREWELTSRASEIEYANTHRIPIDVTKKSPYSLDENLWGTSIECGILEDPWREPPADTYRSVRPVERTPAVPAFVEIGFTRGVPTQLNGKPFGLVALIRRLHHVAGQHGVGRSDLVENRLIGIKSREVYEAPAGTVLLEAHEELERLVLDRELYHFKQTLAVKYAEMVYYGLWFTPLKTALDAFVRETQRRVTGTVRVKLHRGTATAVGRRSAHSRYHQHLATYGQGDQFDQRTAEGFIKLWALPYLDA